MALRMERRFVETESWGVISQRGLNRCEYEPRLQLQELYPMHCTAVIRWFHDRGGWLGDGSVEW